MQNIILSTGILLAIFRSGKYSQNSSDSSLNVNKLQVSMEIKKLRDSEMTIQRMCLSFSCE